MYPSNMQVNYNDYHMFSQGKQRRNKSCELVHLIHVNICELHIQYLGTLKEDMSGAKILKASMV